MQQYKSDLGFMGFMSNLSSWKQSPIIVVTLSFLKTGDIFYPLHPLFLT